MALILGLLRPRWTRENRSADRQNGDKCKSRSPCFNVVHNLYLLCRDFVRHSLKRLLGHKRAKRLKHSLALTDFIAKFMPLETREFVEIRRESPRVQCQPLVEVGNVVCEPGDV